MQERNDSPATQRQHDPGTKPRYQDQVAARIASAVAAAPLTADQLRAIANALGTSAAALLPDHLPQGDPGADDTRVEWTDNGLMVYRPGDLTDAQWDYMIGEMRAWWDNFWALRARGAALGTTVPPWATDSEEIDGGIQWIRSAEILIEPWSTRSDEPDIVQVDVRLEETLTVEDGRTVVERPNPPRIYLGDRIMAPGQARELGETLVEFATLVEGAL